MADATIFPAGWSDSSYQLEREGVRHFLLIIVRTFLNPEPICA
jgi:hypothetical protein